MHSQSNIHPIGSQLKQQLRFSVTDRAKYIAGAEADECSSAELS